MAPRDRYPSDLSDQRWELIEPVLTAWRNERRRHALDIGRRPEHDLRQIMNAILYVDRTGIAWRYLPHDFPNWNTVYGYFARWQTDGVCEQLTGVLRRLVREREGRDAEPSACVLDSQTIKTSANVPRAGQGTDAGKRIIGRKRHLGCDTVGLLLTVLVTAASVSDTAAGVTLLSRIAAAHPRIRKAWVDAGYRTTAIDHGARLGIDVHPVQRPPGAHGFTIIPRRWTIERSIGWLMHHRRLARDYERHPHRSEAMIHLAMIDLMARRLTHEATPNWRGT
ncbi:IS5 family transposase [Streptomyces kunmingensis]|uniref:IS5 family transposase n=1 Tax=Streptomyces kunmingensis TaxID=68225 RepID=A0ABU6CKY7_9ACTN|nr:IS5 family transposase [Streptomyces kunmingensis]MEB3965394.1 IS5 family transposase [Streptomyces kunmingensis]WSV60319.1 IS5 family transposase [Streptomyces sp. NBC_01013]